MCLIHTWSYRRCANTHRMSSLCRSASTNEPAWSCLKDSTATQVQRKTQVRGHTLVCPQVSFAKETTSTQVSFAKETTSARAKETCVPGKPDKKKICIFHKIDLLQFWKDTSALRLCVLQQGVLGNIRMCLYFYIYIYIYIYMYTYIFIDVYIYMSHKL